jgi:hypothetical protein
VGITLVQVADCIQVPEGDFIPVLAVDFIPVLVVDFIRDQVGVFIRGQVVAFTPDPEEVCTLVLEAACTPGHQAIHIEAISLLGLFS